MGRFLTADPYVASGGLASPWHSLLPQAGFPWSDWCASLRRAACGAAERRARRARARCVPDEVSQGAAALALLISDHTRASGPPLLIGGTGRVTDLTSVTGRQDAALTFNLKTMYVYDTMGRPKNLQENGANVTSDVAYGPRREITSLDGEAQTYNALGQVTQVGVRTYSYSATQNNGQITSMIDNGEAISYQYDALNRLVNATGSGWAQGYEYDGFGNLLGRRGRGRCRSWWTLTRTE
jgi:YD repeat-containing protein